MCSTSGLTLAHDYPGIKFVVQPGDAAMLKSQLTGLPAPLTDQERDGYAREAAALLARITTNGQSPFTANLTAAEPALSVAVFRPQTAADAATVLGNLPDPDAQRSLAAVLLDPSQPPEIRKQSAFQLIRSIKRFGPLVSTYQEFRLAASVGEEIDLDLRTQLLAVVRALRRSPLAGSQKNPPISMPVTRSAGVETPVTAIPVPPGVIP